MTGSLGRQVAVAAAFMVGSRFAARLIGVFSTLILARLLVPEDFGIIALAAAAFSIADTALMTGYGALVLRRETVDRDVFDTAWTMNLIRCVLLAGIIVATAPLQAWAFGEPRIEEVLLVVAATAAMEGLGSIGVMRQQRELRFDMLFRLQIAQRILSFVFTVALALLLRNYWCLVLGNLAARLITVPYSYAIAPHRPRLCLVHWREFLNFSKWIFALNICSAIEGHAPNLILGATRGVTETGRYAVAHQISASPISEIAAPIRQPLYAGYAKVKDDPETLRRTFLDSLGLLAAIVLPLSVGIALVAPEIERVALGRSWAGTAPLLSLCALFTLADSFSVFTHNAFLLRDRLRLMVAVFGTTVLFRLPLMLLGAWWGGASGMLGALVAVSVVTAVAWHAVTARVLGYQLSDAIAELRRPAIAAAIMTAAVMATRMAMPDAEATFGAAVAGLLILCGIGALVHLAAVAAQWWMAGRPPGPEVRIAAVVGSVWRQVRAKRPKRAA